MPKKKPAPILDLYAEYQSLCERLGLKPCEFEAWQIYGGLLDEFHIPYLTSYGSTWVHDIRKKTNRTDRPLAVLI